MGIHYEPFDAVAIEDPYPLYRQLRSEAPIYRSPQGFYCISRWEDVQEVLKRADLFSSEEMARLLMNGRLDDLPWHNAVRFMTRFLWRTRLNPFRMGRARNLVALDPPRHDAVRGIVNRGFTPTRIRAWEERAHVITRDCLAPLRAGGDFDVVADLAAPLPTTIIAEILGVEVERQADFRRWTECFIRSVSGEDREGILTEEFFEAITELSIHMMGTIRERRDAPRDDLISVMLERQGDAAMTANEVLQFVVLLLIAGNETTTNLIANATQALLDHPDVLDRVVAEPAEIPRVLEETLRWQPPIQILFRSATEDCEIAGTKIPRGATVAPILASANRDESRFGDAERFDPWREEQGHVGLGFGAHFCLGAALARLEGEIALTALVPELPGLRQVGGHPPLRESFLVRGPASMPLVRESRAA